MLLVERLIEAESVVLYLKKRGLLNQYLKAKRYLLAGRSVQVKMKQRQPHGSGVWSFRINRQFRALGEFQDSKTFHVLKIDNHQ